MKPKIKINKTTYEGIFTIEGRTLKGYTKATSPAQAKQFFITRLVKKLNISRVSLASYFKNDGYFIKAVE